MLGGASMNYYNEFDPHAAAWLRELITAGQIAPGFVDERSIEDVRPDELTGYTQCHFFAGIGGWPLALRLAGWPDDRPIWTGSCPCQPFSAAGKGAGFDDERHLWPAFQWLIQQCGPAVVVGEQVASKAVDAWIDLVQADLEAMGYAFGSVPFPAAGVGAPHIRDRNYWVGHSISTGLEGWGEGSPTTGGRVATHRPATSAGSAVRLADTERVGREMEVQHAGLERSAAGERKTNERGGGSASGGLADTERTGSQGRGGAQRGELNSDGQDGARGADGGLADTKPKQHPNGQPGLGDSRPSPTNGHWGAADGLLCRDGKWRAVESGTFPLVDGLPRGVGYSGDPRAPGYAEKTTEARVMRLKGYGNAIVPQQAAEFLTAYIEAQA